MTKHARTRSQQRGIPPMAIDLLLQFGATVPLGGGATKVYLDKAARRKLHAYAGPLAASVYQHLNIYAVLGADSGLITVAHRCEPIHRQ